MVDAIGDQGRRVAIAREAPAAYRAMAAFDRSIELDPTLHELIKVRASQLNGCTFCIEMHTRAARKAGEDEQRLYATAAWHESPLFTPRERAAFELTDAITRLEEGGIPDGAYEHAAAHFTSAELANLILAVTAINAWNRIALSTRMVFAEPQ
jgi:AhpD family alkylhydroperoxidase